MPQPARGNAIRFAFARELEYGIPGAEPLIDFRPILPAAQRLTPTEESAGTVNPSGFREPGVPAGITGAWNGAHPLTAAHQLELLENLLRGAAREVPQPGVFRYTFTPDASREGTSLWGLLSTPPVEHGLGYGIRIGKLEIAWGANETVTARATGTLSHGTGLGTALPVGALTGTYPYRPIVRGPLAEPEAGDVYLTIDAVEPLTFRTEQSLGAPAFPGAPVAAAIDPTTGRGTWQNLQGADGYDLGLWAENVDPLEIVWPGTAAERALLAPGDTWRIPVSWPDPAPVYLPGEHQRFTSAHVRFEARAQGAAVWQPFHNLEGTLTLEWKLSPEVGDGSRYVTQLDRTGELEATLALTQVYRDARFVEWQRRHQRLELRLAFLGRQLGDGTLRESLVLEMPSVAVLAAERPVSKPGRIEQSLELAGETDAAGTLPLTLTVTGRRDWQPAV